LIDSFDHSIVEVLENFCALLARRPVHQSQSSESPRQIATAATPAQISVGSRVKSVRQIPDIPTLPCQVAWEIAW